MAPKYLSSDDENRITVTYHIKISISKKCRTPSHIEPHNHIEHIPLKLHIKPELRSKEPLLCIIFFEWKTHVFS